MTGFARLGVDVAVIVSDTFGRPWREGQTDVAIGVAGIAPLHSYIGETDPHGHEFRVQELCVVDELAGAAELVKGNTSRVPAAVIRGYAWRRDDDRLDGEPSSARRSATSSAESRPEVGVLGMGVDELVDEPARGHDASARRADIVEGSPDEVLGVAVVAMLGLGQRVMEHERAPTVERAVVGVRDRLAVACQAVAVGAGVVLEVHTAIVAARRTGTSNGRSR